jgi:hypothetical protein
MSVKNSHQVKGYQVQVEKLNVGIDFLKKDISHNQRELADKVRVRDGIKKKIESLESKEVLVSEHAMLRYFERVLGHDLEQIKKDIVTDKIKNMLEVTGPSGTFPADGFKVIIKNGKVVSVV